ncbi:MAG: tRNA (guanosine(46)-N7)-methyltransferase TrmB [Gammaproteobacteria bacterium]|nr:tRNA (guanosine(46)-N7)-methyltransferase TrmB [Gammaproteobacteria bacterium]
MKEDKPETRPQRRVYVRRRSRTTVAQARALEHLDKYILVSDSIEDAFGRSGPVLVEVGFGNGNALAEFALLNPDWNCVGVEVFRPGIGALINQCEQQGIKNVRIVDGEGLTYLESIQDDSIELIWVLFPDPWPKTRHHKRRLVTREFAEVAGQKLTIDGKLLVATDWASYAEDIEKALADVDSLVGGIVEGNTNRITTKYEARGIGLGHSVSEFEYVKRVN